MTKYLTTLLILTLPLLVSAQQTHTLSGHVTNQKSGEALIGATLIDSANLKGTTTNEYGFYSLTLPEGTVELHVSYVGFKNQTFEFNLTIDTSLTIALEPGISMDEVVITENRHSSFLRSPIAGVMTLQPETIERLPVILGESDLIKTIQLLPGVQGGHEGFSGMHVRGGNNDQNLILLDGVPVYNLNHFFGMFSVFNPSVIKDVRLYKGTFPARYHGRTSSVLDIRSKEGNMQEIKGEGSVGLVASKISVEGPIKSDTSSFILSARRTYIDAVMKPAINRAINDGTAGYYFYDLNGKVNYRFSEKSRLYLAGYFGKDRFYERMNQMGNKATQCRPTAIWVGAIKRVRCGGTTCLTISSLPIQLFTTAGSIFPQGWMPMKLSVTPPGMRNMSICQVWKTWPWMWI